MKVEYNKQPLQYLKGANREIAVFSTDGENIDQKVVESFGEEWLKFKDFTDDDIDSVAVMYFDILKPEMLNKNSYALDIGCGTGRWTKYLSKRAGFIEAVDPSMAVVAADHLLADVDNVRITKASVESIPFNDGVFDFVMSIGVLHHIPDTARALKDAAKKVKSGGWFYVYLYHNLETRGPVFRTVFKMSELLRKPVSKMPKGLKKFTCDVLAVTIYMPLILAGRAAKAIGLKKLADKIPLNDYQNKSFFIIRNDALDKFGTALEQRFSKQQVTEMMTGAGLKDIVISPGGPYYHAVGQKM